jgi:hypothetical protein
VRDFFLAAIEACTLKWAAVSREVLAYIT